MTRSEDTPFTQEQIEWLAERDAELDANRERWVIAREKRLAEHGTDWSRKHIRNYSRRALVGFLILLGGLGAAIQTFSHDSADSRKAIVQSGRVISVDGCNRDFTTITRLRSVLGNAKKFQKAALERGDISPQAFKSAEAYYDEQIAGLPLPDCRNATTILTDDPTKPLAIPDPKYPTPPPPKTR